MNANCRDGEGYENDRAVADEKNKANLSRFRGCARVLWPRRQENEAESLTETRPCRLIGAFRRAEEARRTIGSVPEWLKGTGCKPVGASLRWFESNPAHFFLRCLLAHFSPDLGNPPILPGVIGAIDWRGIACDIEKARALGQLAMFCRSSVAMFGAPYGGMSRRVVRSSGNAKRKTSCEHTNRLGETRSSSA